MACQPLASQLQASQRETRQHQQIACGEDEDDEGVRTWSESDLRVQDSKDLHSLNTHIHSGPWNNSLCCECCDPDQPLPAELHWHKLLRQCFSREPGAQGDNPSIANDSADLNKNAKGMQGVYPPERLLRKGIVTVARNSQVDQLSRLHRIDSRRQMKASMVAHNLKSPGTAGVLRSRKRQGIDHERKRRGLSAAGPHRAAAQFTGSSSASGPEQTGNLRNDQKRIILSPAWASKLSSEKTTTPFQGRILISNHLIGPPCVG